MKWLQTRRKIKNVQLTRGFQIKYYGWWFLVSLILIFLLSASSYWLFEEHWREILLRDPQQVEHYVFGRSRFVSNLVLLSLVLVIGITCLGILTAHRVAGPLIALRNAFEEVKKGNLDFRLHFRREDELFDLEKTFNEMMDTLQKGKQSKN